MWKGILGITNKLSNNKPSQSIQYLTIAFFSCRETWEKVNLTWHDNGTLSYHQKKTYIFDDVNSAGSEDDVVVVPNIPMLVSQQKFLIIYIEMVCRVSVSSCVSHLFDFIPLTVAQCSHLVCRVAIKFNDGDISWFHSVVSRYLSFLPFKVGYLNYNITEVSLSSSHFLKLFVLSLSTSASVS